MISRYMPLFTLVFVVAILLSACSGIAPTKEIRTIDSINALSYNYKYKDLDSSFYYAKTAFSKASLYTQGKAEACNNLAFCAFIAMDFDKAEQMYKEVYSLTQNELECLIADIGLMKIYQRVAQNKLYYDYRNSALRRMKRIREDSTVFTDKHEIERLTYAFSEFYIVSGIYYYYQQQQTDALASLDEVDQNRMFNKDANQYLYYHYIKGAAGLFPDKTYNERRLASFDQLYNVYLHSSRGGYLYFTGNSLQGIADLLASPGDFSFFLSRRRDALLHLNLPVDSLLPLRLGQQALSAFNQYGDIYQIAGAYVSISRYLNQHGHYAEALDSLAKALDYVNHHHSLYYHSPDDHSDHLQTYSKDTLYNEMHWITQEKVKTVPEWIARIREQLSVSYAGIGKKAESDYNRNIYLDILNDTRQDKELESRYLYLEKESSQLTLLLVLVIAGFLLVILFFWFFNKRSKKRNHIYLARLQQILSLCKDITASVPMNITLVQGELNNLFGHDKIKLETNEDDRLVLSVKSHLNKNEQALYNILAPYVEWVAENEQTIAILSDERNQLEKQRYLYEKHIITNKRENIVKKACLFIVNGITPYIDRILNEADKLVNKGFINDQQIKKDKYQYIDELVTTINDYNEILALWIKMKQGKLSLNIETFSLKELFELIAKGKRSFEMKGLELIIEENDYWIKADKALTLFMINTLAENARKYTPAGGVVNIYARQHDDYIEISVKDTGIGLSEEDIHIILGEKVYDSCTIGIKDAPDAETLLLNKGGGFGLMNCKGIIDKYRKTNDFFRQCLFSIESTKGKGSRFYFRLPIGQRRFFTLLAGIFLTATTLFSCSKPETDGVALRDYTPEEQVADSLYDELLNEASDYANAAYYANIDRSYEEALVYIDSALILLNQHYQQFGPLPATQLLLSGNETPAEIDWWNKQFDTDYHVILDIRNEASVAFLALKQLDEYKFNNDAYTSLYKLQSEDHSLEAFCMELEHSAINKTIGIIICIILLIILIVGYYFLSIRKRLKNRDNLRQILEINRRIYSSSLLRTSGNSEALQREEDTLKDIPNRIVGTAYDTINDLLDIEILGLAVYNSATHHLIYASTPVKEAMPGIIETCFDKRENCTEDTQLTIPLIVDADDNHPCIGVLYFKFNGTTITEQDHLLAQLIATYMTIVIFNTVVKPATKFRDIESAHEEARRASWEESLLHVQNMVLDNCLSTIKHETIYYPNKIKQIIGRLNKGDFDLSDEKENILAVSELITYYKGVFTILSSCASRQLEEVTFRRSTIEVGELLTSAEKYFRKAAKNFPGEITLTVSPAAQMKVLGDVTLLNYLLECLVNEALTSTLSGEIKLSAQEDGDFIRFLFTDMRRDKTQQELNHIFYPNLAVMTGGEDTHQLRGTEYLICKQIIRDHDEYAGRRGCRINAEPAAGGGYTVYFTLPARKR